MATYYTLLTKIGQARIANAVALNQKVNLTYMAVGDGNGNPTTPNENQTALVREKYRATINQLTVDPDNPNYLVAELIVPTNVGGWSIYEVGVFDDQNQLIAVANFPATYKPELAEGSGRDLIVRIIIQVSNTSVVTLKIDPAITLASQAWVAANYVKKVTVAGGTTGQVLVKKSNANEDFQWVDPTAAVDVNVFSREETQTVATGQTIINLAQLTTDGAAIYIEGIRLRDDQFTVNSPTRLTLATSYPAGTKVTIVQNEETSRNAFTLKANNLSDLTDKSVARTNLGLGDANGYVGRKIAEQWITSSKTVTLNPLTKRIKVTLTGGGGGGGGAFNGGDPSNNFSGGGGAAGATGIKWFNVSDITNWALVIGSGGTEATKGGDSTFSGMVAIGGASSVASGVFSSGGIGAAGTGADINLPGGDGGDGQSGTHLLSGFGGASYWGGCRRAGQGQPGTETISQTVIPGGGGGGAFDTQKLSTRFYGGQGGNGCCLIEEFA